jgi:hypothetical protein
MRSCLHYLRSIVALSAVAGCVGADEPELASISAPGTTYQGTTYQGTTYQGTTYQGTTYQGTTYQGTTYQGTTYQGASYGGASATGKIGSKTSLEIWRWLSSQGEWEQRTPSQLCYWDVTKTYSSCTTVVVNAFNVSPLAGAQFNATFHDPTTNTTRTGILRIGATTTTRGAVVKDTTRAMHPLIGQSPGSVTACDNPRNCASNSDLFLYDVELVDTDGSAVKFCPPGEKAHALAGTWGLDGTYAASTTQFTFACTNGTISKCTRWGYRPFGSAQLSDNATMRPLADYHQTCVRAAMADYCADGRSFTRNGTQIDIYDYTPGTGQIGLVPRTANIAPAFLWESGFDKLGAVEIERFRYQELAPYVDPAQLTMCPNRPNHLDEVSDGSSSSSSYTSWPIYIASMNGCRHSEGITGRPLSRHCSACVARVVTLAGIGRPSCESSAWDSQCVSLVGQLCSTAPRMTPHDECTTGAALGKVSTACTWDVCSDPAYASCCTTGWTSTCTAAANARCTGGGEYTVAGGTRYGFCGVVLLPVLSL